MPSQNDTRHEEANDAAWEATKGAVYGAFKYGAAFAVLGGIGYGFSPLYRGLTIQFKVYLQMSGMVIGSMIEADYQLRQYEAQMRLRRRIAKDRAVWREFEKEYGKDGDD